MLGVALFYQHYLGDDYTLVEAGLSQVDARVAPIATEVGLGQGGIQGLLGLDILFNREMILQVQYRHEKADRLKMHGGQVKFSMRF